MDGLSVRDGVLLRYSGTEEAVTVPDGVRRIGAYAFAGCSELRRVMLPNEMTEIGPHAFEGCGRLNGPVLPQGLRVLAEGLFRGCRSLRELSIPDTVTMLDADVFRDCTALERVELPDSVTVLGDRVFYRCGALAELRLPRGLRRIGLSVFYGTVLRRMTLPEMPVFPCADDILDGVLEDHLFDELTSLVLPEGMETLPELEAYGMPNVRELTLTGPLWSAEGPAAARIETVRAARLSMVPESLRARARESDGAYESGPGTA